MSKWILAATPGDYVPYGAASRDTGLWLLFRSTIRSRGLSSGSAVAPDEAFAGLSFTCLGSNPRDEVTADDLLAVSLLDIAWRPDAVRQLLGAGAGVVSGMLGAISSDIDLWDASDADLASSRRQPAADLGCGNLDRPQPLPGGRTRTAQRGNGSPRTQPPLTHEHSRRLVTRPDPVPLGPACAVASVPAPCPGHFVVTVPSPVPSRIYGIGGRREAGKGAAHEATNGDASGCRV